MKLTGSGFGRAEKCPASTFLPHVLEQSSHASARGSAIHRFLCLVAEVGRDAALALIEEEHRETCAIIELDALPHSTPDAWGCEVAFAWDSQADTARELYRGSGAREYGELAEHEVAGTADLVGLADEGKTVIILDVKTGWAPLGPPAESLQLLFYAVAAARAYGAEKAVVGFVRLTDGYPVYQYATVDGLDLELAAERLKRVLFDARMAEVDYGATNQVTPVAGDHCTYCPAFSRCPAKVTLARELAVQSLSLDPTQLTPVLDVTTAAAVIERLWAVQELLKRVESVVDEFARAHPVTLSDGRVYGAIETSKESFDAALGGKALAQKFGVSVAAECVEVSSTLTKAAIKRALAKVAEKTGGKVTHLEREAHEAIRDAGASRVAVFTQVKAFKPKAQR
jgi:RecB family exonuclease